MAKEENILRDLREENEELSGIENGSIDEFFDILEPEDREKFKEMEALAESKKKWLRMFDKLLKQIAERDFDDALSTFELLSDDLFD